MKMNPSDPNSLPPMDFPRARIANPIRDVVSARSALAQSHLLPFDKQTDLRRRVNKKFPGLGKAHAMAQALKGFPVE